MRSKRTSVVNTWQCAICGRDFMYWGDPKPSERIETVITKRNTVVKFHRKCYEKMLKEQRKER